MANATSLSPKGHTPLAVLSYPFLFTPRAQKNDDGTPGKLMYSCSMVFLPETDLTEMKQMVLDGAREQFGDKAIEMLRIGKLKSPFRKDAEAKGYPVGSQFINISSKSPPGIVSWRKDPKTGKPAKLTDETEVYAGRHCRASVGMYYYDNKGNKGISFSLKNIQILRADEGRWDGRLAAEDDFEADDAGADQEDKAESADLSDIL